MAKEKTASPHTPQYAKLDTWEEMDQTFAKDQETS